MFRMPPKKKDTKKAPPSAAPTSDEKKDDPNAKVTELQRVQYEIQLASLDDKIARLKGTQGSAIKIGVCSFTFPEFYTAILIVHFF